MYHEHVAVTVLTTTSDIQACLEQGIARDLMHCIFKHPVHMVPGIAVTSFFVSFLCPVCSRFAAE